MTNSTEVGSRSQQLFDILGRKSFDTTKNMGKFKAPWLKEKSRAMIEIKSFCEFYHQKLKEYNNQVGALDELHPFYRESLQTMIPFDRIRKAAAHLVVTRTLLEKIKRESLSRIAAVKNESDQNRIGLYRKKFLGRAKSIILRLDDSLELISQVGRAKRDLPGVNVHLPTFVLAGFPNVGKSTILQRWTSSPVKIASYPFTTQSVQVGKITYQYAQIQVLDTPGLLDRLPQKSRNAIEQHAIRAITYLAHLIVYIVDASNQSQYSIQDQKQLFDRLKELFPAKKIVIIANKMDECDFERLEEIKENFSTFGQEGIGFEGQGLNFVLNEWKTKPAKTQSTSL